MPQVFISHSTEDRCFVEQEILPLLKDHHVDTWYSQEDIQTAERWEQSIRKGLEGSDWFLVVMSPRAAVSTWVRREVHWAMEERQNRLIPVLIEPCDLDAWHLGFKELQYVDFYSNKRAARKRLLAVWGLDNRGNGTSGKENLPSTDNRVEADASDDLSSAESDSGQGGGVLTQNATDAIELVIDRNIDTYTPEDQTKLLAAIKELLRMPGDIRVLRKRPGSVKLTLDLTPEQTEKLLYAVKAGELAEFGVVDAILVPKNGVWSSEMLDREDRSDHPQRDKREVSKLANRGHLPGRKVAGEWRFARAEINDGIETLLPAYTEEQLRALEAGDVRSESPEPLVAKLLARESVGVPLVASTRASAFRELVRLAEQTWQVYDPEAILDAIRQREEMGSTGLENGVALPHPRRPLPAALGEAVIAYGRSASGIPIGAPNGVLTDVFFLVCCRYDEEHRRVLARLSRLLLQPGFLNELRAAATAAESWGIIAKAERRLLA